MICEVNTMRDEKMAMIPYIEHELRIHKVYDKFESELEESYKREQDLKLIVAATNIFWIGLTLLLILVR